MPTRRRALRTAAGAAAAFPILGQQHQHAPASSPATAAYKPKWASPAEMKQLAAIADLILPRTDTPGASDAKVHEYIDFQLNNDKPRQQTLRTGLEWMAAQPDPTAALTKASTAAASSKERLFFDLMKGLTIDGYYQSKEGLVTELGWHGNTYLPKWDGCTHPEHKG
jgi:hypothetical protein